jgi:hypothetical protein
MGTEKKNSLNSILGRNGDNFVPNTGCGEMFSVYSEATENLLVFLPDLLPTAGMELLLLYCFSV